MEDKISMAKKSNSVKREPTIDDIINEIKSKSEGGDYIYRGERKEYDNVSSALYREYVKIGKHIEFDSDIFDLRIVQKHMLKVAKKHIGEPHQDIYLGDSARHRFIPDPTLDLNLILTADEIELLTQLQHYGSETNLIDFTTDYLIAIFFACSGHPKEDGRVIVLERTNKIKKMIIPPQNPQHRVIAQKSIFLHPSKGFIDVPNNKKVRIPFTHKRELLMYLRQYHGISTETIYNDIYGFIRNQNIQKNAYVQFYLGLTYQNRGYRVESDAGKQEEYIFAIEHYNDTISLDPEISVAYGNRAECWLHLGNWEKAREDFIIGSDMGLDIIDSFHNDYENVAEFEEKTGFKMPEDLAEMLGG